MMTGTTMAASMRGWALSLADFTRPSLLRLGWRVGDAGEAVEELGRALVYARCVPEFLSLYHAVINREFLLSTAFAPGVAMPHVRMPTVDRLWFALGSLREPIPWLNRHGPSVSMVFLSASPLNDTAEYLGYRSAVARLIRDKGTLAALQRASDATAILAVLGEVPVMRDARHGTALESMLTGNSTAFLDGRDGHRGQNPPLEPSTDRQEPMAGPAFPIEVRKAG